MRALSRRFAQIILAGLSWILIGTGLAFAGNITVQIMTIPDQDVLPFEINFEAGVSGGTPPFSFTWNFGDGGSSTLQNPVHLYRESGKYTVWLGVLDASGNYGAAASVISVSAGTFNPKDALFTTYSSTNQIVNIVEDRRDTNVLWIGTLGGLVRLDLITKEKKFFTHEFPGKEVTSLIQSSDGAIWVGTWNGLARFDDENNRWTLYDTSSSGLPDDYINSLFQSSDGAVWIGTDQGLARFDYAGNQWTHYDASNSSLPGHEVRSLCQSSDGAIWAGTNQGLARFNYTTNQWKIYDLSNSSLPNGTIHSVLQSSDGAIWIGADEGLARFDDAGNQWTLYDTSNSGMPGNQVKSILQSSDGAIWVGTDNGLGRLDRESNQWTVYNTANSALPKDFIGPLLQSSGGAIWIGTWNGLTRFDFGSNQWTIHHTSNSGLLEPIIISLLQSSDKAFWIGTNGGLARFDYANNRWSLYNESNSDLPGDWVNFLVQSSDGAIWVGTGDGLARFVWESGQWTIYNTSNSDLPDDFINCLIQSSDGAIWAGTDSGLARFDFQSGLWTIYDGSNSSLPGYGVYSLVQSSDGAIWAGTGNGLARFLRESNHWTVYNTSNSRLAGDWIFSFLNAFDDAVWVGTINGLSRISFPKFSVPPGRLVLVAGGGAQKTNTLWPTTKELAAFAYRIFSSRGYRNTDIYFMSPEKWVDVNGDGFDDHVVDCPMENDDRNLTVQDLRDTITGWAVDNYNSGTPLYIYLIDHGYSDDGVHGPYFEVAPGELLYAGILNDMLDDYEEETGGQVILINESCYSGQFLERLKKAGRIVITATSNKIASYDNQGANSFSHFFLRKLFENDSLQQAFAKALQRLRNYRLTYLQTPQLDDNGDGKHDMADGILASTIKLGGDFTVGAPWPEILSVTHSQLAGTQMSFTATANAHMKRVWATVQPPDYVPDTTGDYQLIESESFDLFDDDDNLTYAGTYDNFDQTGGYVLTIHAKDQFGNVAVSDPIEIDVGIEGQNLISGNVRLVLEGYAVSIDNADITATVLETGKSSPIDHMGHFSIRGISPGTYTIKVEGPGLAPLAVSDVSVVSGQSTTLSPIEIQVSTSDGSHPGDATGDGKIGLKDAIFILQTLSRVRE